MSEPLVCKNVAVAVIYDAPSDKFLLWNNKRWPGYAFPMKQFDPAEVADPGRAALAALDDWDMELKLPHASATAVDRLVLPFFSEGTHRVTVYDYRIYLVDPGTPGIPASLHPDFRYFACDELRAAPNVTAPTKAIAGSLLEDRRVALSVIARTNARGIELLLVRSKAGEYFFPATRMKTDVLPAEAARRAIALDLGYEGPVTVAAQSEVPALQPSLRFGSRQVRFYFQLCLLDLPDLDLNAPGNLLEQSLHAIEAGAPGGSHPGAPRYGAWFGESALRSGSGLSASMPLVLNTALQLIKRPV